MSDAASPVPFVPAQTAPFRRAFLSARWTDLAMLSYAVDPQMLARLLPAGLEPDLLDGRAFVSLVAFRFQDTRVFNFCWPGYRNFPEVNLRCYVRQGERRGVLFIRELVQPRLVAWIARAFYNEPYAVCCMGCDVRSQSAGLSVQYDFRVAGRPCSIAMEAADPPTVPPPDSPEHFFKEQRWGFGRDRAGRVTCYEVIHPPWRIYPNPAWKLTLDWAAVYGRDWAHLQDAQPASAMLVEGSEVSVYPIAR